MVLDIGMLGLLVGLSILSLLYVAALRRLP
jgi:hypothetical protein